MKYTKEFQEYITNKCKSYQIEVQFFSDNYFVILPTDNLQDKINEFCGQEIINNYQLEWRIFKEDVQTFLDKTSDMKQEKSYKMPIHEYFALFGKPESKFCKRYFWNRNKGCPYKADFRISFIRCFWGAFFVDAPIWNLGFGFDENGITKGEDFIFDLYEEDFRGKTMTDVIKYFAIPSGFNFDLDKHAKEDIRTAIYNTDICSSNDIEIVGDFFLIYNVTNEKFNILKTIFDSVCEYKTDRDKDGFISCLAIIKDKGNILEFGCRLLTYCNYVKQINNK